MATNPNCVAMLVRPLPRHIKGGWDAAKTQLAARATAQLDRFAPGLASRVVAVEVVTPDDIAARYGHEDEFGGPVGVKRLLSNWRLRARTPIKGLYLCGASVQPMGAVSGRAARMAVAQALLDEVMR